MPHLDIQDNPGLYIKDFIPPGHFCSYYNRAMAYTIYPRIILDAPAAPQERALNIRVIHSNTYTVYTRSGLFNLAATVSMCVILLLGILTAAGILSSEAALLSSGGLLLAATIAQYMRKDNKSKTFDVFLTGITAVSLLIIGCGLAQSTLACGSVLIGATCFYGLMGGIAPRFYHLYKLRHPDPETLERHNRFHRVIDPHLGRGAPTERPHFNFTPPSFLDVLRSRNLQGTIVLT